MDMLKRKVLIEIKGTQRGEFSTDSIDFVTEGMFYKKLGKYYIVYKESLVTGLSGTTTVKVEKGKVTMTRINDGSSQMIFEPGKRHLSHYDTGFGIFNVGVSTMSAHSNLSDCGGEVSVKYAIEINSSHAGVNTFYINVKETDNVNNESSIIS